MSPSSRLKHSIPSSLHALSQSVALLIPEFLFQIHISALVVVLLPRKIALLSSNTEKGTKLAIIYSVGAIIASIVGPLIGISIDVTGFRRLWILMGIIGDVICIFLLGFVDYFETLIVWFFVATFITVSAVAWSGWISSQNGGKTSSNVSRLAFFGFLGSAVGSQVGYISDLKVAFAVVAFVMGAGMIITLIVGEEEGSSCLVDILQFLFPSQSTTSLTHQSKPVQSPVSPLSVALGTKSYKSMEPSDIGTSSGNVTPNTLIEQCPATQAAPGSPVSLPLSGTADDMESSSIFAQSLPASPKPEPYSLSDEEGDDTPTEKGSLTSLWVDVDNSMYKARRSAGCLHQLSSFLKTTIYTAIGPLWESSTYRYLVLGNFLMHMGIDSVLSFMLFFFRDVYAADEIHVHVFNFRLNASSTVAFISPFIMGGSLTSSVCFVVFPFISEVGSLWMMISSALMIILPLALIVSTSRWFLAVCAAGLFYGLGQGIFTCMNWVLAVRCVQRFKWKHSQTLGLWQSFSIIARLVSSTIGGFIIDRWIHVTVPWFGNNLPVSYLIVMCLSMLYFISGGLIMLKACKNTDTPADCASIREPVAP